MACLEELINASWHLSPVGKDRHPQANPDDATASTQQGAGSANDSFWTDEMQPIEGGELDSSTADAGRHEDAAATAKSNDTDRQVARETSGIIYA